MIMNEIVSKIKSFFLGNYKTMAIVGGIIIVCFLVWYVFSGRENVSSNGVSIDDVRTELSNAQDTKSDIADTATAIKDTVGELQDSIGKAETAIDTATGASSKFDAIIDECTGIIEQIRKQPAGE